MYTRLLVLVYWKSFILRASNVFFPRIQVADFCQRFNNWKKPQKPSASVSNQARLNSIHAFNGNCEHFYGGVEKITFLIAFLMIQKGAILWENNFFSYLTCLFFALAFCMPSSTQVKVKKKNNLCISRLAVLGNCAETSICDFAQLSPSQVKLIIYHINT